MAGPPPAFYDTFLLPEDPDDLLRRHQNRDLDAPPPPCRAPGDILDLAVSLGVQDRYPAMKQVLAYLSSCATATPSQRYDALFLLGVSAARRHEPGIALKSFAPLPASWLKERDLVSALYHFKVSALVEQRAYRQAREALDRLTALPQQDRYVLYGLGFSPRLDLLQGSPRKAVATATAVLPVIAAMDKESNFPESHEQAAQVLLTRAQAHQALGNARGRRDDLMKLFLEYPHTLAAAQAQKVVGGGFEQMVLDFTRGDEKMLKDVVESFYVSGKAELALRILVYYWRRDPTGMCVNKPLMASLMGEIYLKLHRDEEASQVFATLMKLWPDNPRHDYWLTRQARAFSRLGRWREAADCYRELLRRHPEDAQGREYLLLTGWQDGQNGDLESSAQLLTDYLARKGLGGGDRVVATRHLAWVRFRQDRHDLSAGLWESLAVSRLHNDYTAGARYWQAMSLLQLGQREQAVSLLRSLAGGNDPSYYALLAWQRLKDLPRDQVTSLAVALPQGEVQGRLGGVVGAWRRLSHLAAPTLVASLATWAPRASGLADFTLTVANGDGAGGVIPSWLPPGDAPLPPDSPRLMPDGLATADRLWHQDSRTLAVYGAAGVAMQRRCALYKPLGRAMVLAGLGLPQEAVLDNRVFFRALEGCTRRGRLNLPADCQQPAEALADVPFYRYLVDTGSYGEAYRLHHGHYFPYPKPEGLAQRLSRSFPPFHAQAVTEAAAAFRVPPELAMAIMLTESNFSTLAVSRVGARGLMQLMPATALNIARITDYPDFHPSRLNEAGPNIAMGMWYLGKLLERFQGNMALAAAAYNAGPQAVSVWLEKHGGLPLEQFVESIPYRETRRYVKRVLALANRYRLLYSGRTALVDFHRPPPHEKGSFPNF